MTSVDGFDGAGDGVKRLEPSCHCSDDDDDGGGAMMSAFWVCAVLVRVGRLQPKILWGYQCI